MQKYFVNVTNQSPEARSMGRSSKWLYLGTFYSDAAFALRDLLYFQVTTALATLISRKIDDS